MKKLFLEIRKTDQTKYSLITIKSKKLFNLKKLAIQETTPLVKYTP